MGTGNASSRITEVTRRNLFDELLSLPSFSWSGRLNEVEFFGRVFDLDALPPSDQRCRTARDDIRWHRLIDSDDWPFEWPLTYEAFDLWFCPDETLLKLLCELVHPRVRASEEEVATLVAIFNKHLSADGWQLVSEDQISGRPVYGPVESLPVGHAATAIRAIAGEIDQPSLNRQIARLHAANDPALAIGTAKELIESICKWILREKGKPAEENLELPRLVGIALKELALVPEHVAKAKKGEEALRSIVGSLVQAATRIGQLRSLYGTGHGQEPSAKTDLEPHHVHLIVAASSALATYLFEAHQAEMKGWADD